MRKAFSLLTAIVMIVLMSAVAALVFNISGKTTKETSTQYRKEQAILLAKSYTEYAILAIQGHNIANNGCLQTITAQVNTTTLGGANAAGAINGEGYLITVRIQYLDVNNINNIPGGCPAALVDDIVAGLFNNNPTVLIDVNVRYRDLSHMDALLASGMNQAAARNAAQFVNYNHRTLQSL